MALCGNNGWGSCRCHITDCYLCKNDKCADSRYPEKYVCFDCQIVWDVKEELYKNCASLYMSMTMEEYRKKVTGKPRCRTCRKEGVRVGRNFRAPKKKNKAMWELTRKVIYQTDEVLERLGEREDLFAKMYADVKELPYRTLSEIFQKMQYKYDTSHQHHRRKESPYYIWNRETNKYIPNPNIQKVERLKIWYPKRKRDYGEFIYQLRSTVLIDKLDYWDLIRFYVKIRSITNYMKKLAKKRREMENTILVLAYTTNEDSTPKYTETGFYKLPLELIYEIFKYTKLKI